jgi:hypothetical protein
MLKRLWRLQNRSDGSFRLPDAPRLYAARCFLKAFNAHQRPPASPQTLSLFYINFPTHPKSRLLRAENISSDEARFSSPPPPDRELYIKKAGEKKRANGPSSENYSCHPFSHFYSSLDSVAHPRAFLVDTKDEAFVCEQLPRLQPLFFC